MSDIPYEKAIEETAKTTGKALDLIKGASPAIADIYGYLIGDSISQARKRRLHDLAEETKRLLEDRGVRPEPAPEQIAIPLLEAAQGESRPEMATRWATLLANAMDPARAQDVRPDFVQTLKQIQPSDALVLETMVSVIQHPTNTSMSPDDLKPHAKELRRSQIEMSMAKLTDLRCLRADTRVNGNFALTGYGLEFFAACKP